MKENDLLCRWNSKEGHWEYWFQNAWVPYEKIKGWLK